MSNKAGGAELATKMIARIWKGRVRNATADEYADYLYKNGVQHLMAVDGNLGVQMFRKSEQDATEFMVVSYWDPRKAEAAIKSFGGSASGKAWLLNKDQEYLLDAGRSAEHYELLFETRTAHA